MVYAFGTWIGEKNQWWFAESSQKIPKPFFKNASQSNFQLTRQ